MSTQATNAILENTLGKNAFSNFFGQMFEEIKKDIRLAVREELEASKLSSQQDTELEEYIKAKDVAKLICCPVGSVYQLVHQHKIPHIKMSAKKLIFNKREIKKWLEEGNFKPYKTK